MNRKILIGVGILIILAVAYWLLSPFWRNVVLNEELPGATVQSTVIASAEMIAEAHEVEGTALLLTSGNEAFLRFENLKTINGPDLRIYLSADLSADDIVDLGPIRATEGNINYAIPAGTDLGRYKYAMIWCRTFGVLFSYAQFESAT